MDKPILCLDFDGVIHDYKRGWQEGVICGNLTPGFLDWALEAHKLFKLVVYSSRSRQAEGVVKMSDWITQQAKAEGWQMTDRPFDGRDGEQLLRLLHARRADVICFYFAHEKPPAFLTIDDRCIPFLGTWSELVPQALRAFRPWMMNE